MPIEELISRVNISALSPNEQENFKVWLTKNIGMQLTIETALRRGHTMKAYVNTYRKQSEYWVKIEDPASES